MIKPLLDDLTQFYSKNQIDKGSLKLLYTKGKPPFGYDVNHKTKEYIVNKSEAVIIRAIFEMYSQNMPYKELLEFLNTKGYRSKHGRNFTQTSLHGILRNEKYAGIYAMKTPNGIIHIQNAIPAIISTDVFAMIQEKLKRNKTNSQTYKAFEPYILSGKIYCGQCGGKLFGNRRKSAKSQLYWSGYQCSNKKKYKNCDAKEVKKENIEEFVLHLLETDIFTDEYIENASKRLLETYNESLIDIDNDITTLQSDAFDTHNKINNLVEALASGLSSSSVKSKLEELELHKSELNARITKEQFRKAQNLSLDQIRTYLNVYKNISTKSAEEQKRIIELFVDKIVVSEDKIDIYLTVE